MSDETSQQALEFIPPSAEHLGSLLPSYHFEKLIAKGGMGAVYKATQTSLDRPVAVKVLPPELGQSESFRDSFVKEAKLMARLNHPNLISVFDFGEVEGMLYIVMEFVDGATLFDRTHGGHLDQVEALEVVIAICRGLENAHQAGILHRDIKPANIFITEKGTPKIGDFGLARPSGDTETGVIFGTPGYTAPEVLRAPELVGPATDVFSVGVMLYELLAGKLPNDIYEPITKYAKCDLVIDRLIRKAIAPVLQQRYPNAESFADDLDEVYRKLKKAAKSQPTQLRTAAAQAKTPALATAATRTAATRSPQLNTTGAVGAKAIPRTSLAGPKKVSSGGGTAVRNFFIILLLLAGIYGALELKKSREANNARILKENAEAERLAEIENAARKKAAQKKVVREATPEEAAPVVEVKRSVMETLDALQAELVAGERPTDAFPDETIQLNGGDRLVLFIDKALTWHQAELWAKSYGAQLATIEGSNDLASLRNAIPTGKTAWVGAATAGNKKWAWTDGTTWNDEFEIRPTSKLAFAQVDSDLFATPKKSSDTSGFLVEWKADGSTPAELSERMSRTAAKLNDLTPTYPAGSVSFGQRNYYLCPFPLSLDQAIELAAKAGGHIATPSNTNEARLIAKLIAASVPQGEQCRLGARLNGNQWQWLTGEKWQTSQWDADHPQDGDSLVIVSSKKAPWRDVSSSDAVAYTLFEWSSDAKALDPNAAQSSTAASDSEFAKLQQKAAELIKKSEATRSTKYAANVKRLKWDLDLHLKGLASTEKAQQEPTIKEIKKLLDSSKFITDEVTELGNSKIQKIATAAYEKQSRIDSEQDEALEKIRVVYQKKLRVIISDLEAAHQMTAANQAKRALKASNGDSKDFAQIFN